MKSGAEGVRTDRLQVTDGSKRGYSRRKAEEPLSERLSEIGFLALFLWGVGEYECN